MSATIVYEGLKERFATVSGIKAIRLGEPTAVHDPPQLYTVGLRFERTLRNAPPASNPTGTHYFFIHRLTFRWQDSEQAEKELLTYIDAMFDAIDDDPRLGGRLNKHLLAKVTEANVGFSTIGTTLYRVVDFTTETLYKV